MSITYRFSPVPFEFKRKMMEELRGNQYKIMDGIAEEVCLYPDTRTTFTKELSCRYLESIVNIRYDHISRHLKKLETKGFIKILQLGKYKEDGSIIQIIVPNSGTHNETSPESGTNQAVIVPESGTKSVELVPKSGTKQETNIQENNQETTPPNPVKSVVSPKSIKNNNRKDFSLIGSLLPAIPKPEIRSTHISINKIDSLEFTGPAVACAQGTRKSDTTPEVPAPPLPHPAGIADKTLAICYGILQKRGIENISSALGRSIEQMNRFNSSIKNKDGYLVSLCKSMSLEELSGNASVVQAAPVTSIGNVSVNKTEEYIKRLTNSSDEEKKQQEYETILKALVEKYPDQVYEVYQSVNKNPFNKAVPDSARPVLYISEFKRKFPALAIS